MLRPTLAVHVNQLLDAFGTTTRMPAPMPSWILSPAPVLIVSSATQPGVEGRM